MTERQTQRAGDNSSQVMVTGDLVVVQGVTELRAQEIAYEAAKAVVANYSEEAAETGLSRIQELDERIVAALSKAEKLEAFADPAFQVDLRRAQIGAASSGQSDDYDLLASLLADRAERADERKITAGISHAIETVDKLDAESLRGLTVLQGMSQYVPNSPATSGGLDTLESLYSELVDGPLPEGPAWLDHLDVLGVVRINSVSKWKKPRAFFCERLGGYASPGLAVGSEAFESAQAELMALGIDLPLMSHESKKGFARPGFSGTSSFERWLDSRNLDVDATSRARDVVFEKFGLAATDDEMWNWLEGEFSTRPTVQIAYEWFSRLPIYAEVTGVGRVLARANADRLDTKKLLPKLD